MDKITFSAEFDAYFPESTISLADDVVLVTVKYAKRRVAGRYVFSEMLSRFNTRVVFVDDTEKRDGSGIVQEDNVEAALIKLQQYIDREAAREEAMTF